MSGLAALYQQCIFRSREQMETHGLVAAELSDHHLHWEAGRVDTRLYKFDTPRLSLYSLRYGPEVGICPVVYDHFSLVHFSLTGPIEVQADGVRRLVPQGSAVISSPRRNIRLRWSEGSEQLILRLPHSLMAEAAHTLGRPDLLAAVCADPGRMLAPTAALHWRAQLEAFVAVEGVRHKSADLAPWLAHMEQGLAMFLLLNGSGVVDDTDPRGLPQGRQRRRRIDRLHAYATARLGQPIALADLARVAALSERQLNALCHAELGRSPMVWLRELRLDAVRVALIADPGADLADLAMTHGFFHLGRFSAYYRERFGELPSQTRKFARNG